MIEISLKRENFIDWVTPPGGRFESTTNPSVIQNCIDMFNSEIQWDGMFDLDTAIERIKNGDKMFVGYYMEEVCLYCWLKKIDENEYYIYNCFSKSKPIKRPLRAVHLVNYVIKTHCTGVIRWNINEWNIKSINATKKIGAL